MTGGTTVPRHVLLPASARTGGRAFPLAILAVLLCAFMALTIAGPATPASAAADDPTSGPAHKDELPVTITVDSITPTTLGPNGTLTITATVTNKGKEVIEKPWVRLQRNQAARSRGDLFELDSSQPGYTSGIGPITDLTSALAPGDSKQIEATASTKQLKIDEQGVYPVLININGETASGQVRVGQSAVSVPYFVTAPTAQTRVGWVLPLADRPHRSATSTRFLDDGLTALVSPGGRLYRLLGMAEKYAETAQLTLMVDPELIDALNTMAAGYQYIASAGKDKGKALTGNGGTKATDWLDRLTELAKTVPILTTPYADVDTVALARNNLGSIAVDARKRGTTIVDDVLKTKSISDVAMPTGGVITDQAVGVERQAGVNQLVLGGSAFGQSDYLESNDGITESAVTKLNVVGTEMGAIVADPALTRILGDASSYVAGPVAGAQRLNAELAAIAMQAPGSSRGILVVPPKRWDPSPKLIDAVLTATTATPWIAPVSFDSLLADEAVNRGALEYPGSASASEIPAAAMARVQQSSAGIDGMVSPFEEADVPAVLGPYREAIYRAVSSAYRGDPATVQARATDVDVALSALRGAVQIVPPSNGTYTLASSNAPLPFTIENKLSVPVKYVISLDERRSPGVKVASTGVLQIAPNSRATVTVPTVVERSGTFSVVAQIRTPNGQSLGEDVRVSVRSSVYGSVALAVTGAAFALLLVLIARRWVLRVRNRRAQAEADARAAAAALEAADEPVPFGDYTYQVSADSATASVVVPDDPVPEDETPTVRRSAPSAQEPGANETAKPDDPDDQSWLDRQVGKPR